MKCDRCGGNGYTEENRVVISSGLGGGGGDVVHSGSCILCGLFKFVNEAAKPIDIKVRCQDSRPEFVDLLPNKEPTIEAVKRCNLFFGQYKTYIKVQLMKGRTFLAIYDELNQKNKECPSRSWMRKTYLSWVNNQDEKEIQYGR